MQVYSCTRTKLNAMLVIWQRADVYLKTVFWLTNLVFLGQCSSGPDPAREANFVRQHNCPEMNQPFAVLRALHSVLF